MSGVLGALAGAVGLVVSVSTVISGVSAAATVDVVSIEANSNIFAAVNGVASTGAMGDVTVSPVTNASPAGVSDAFSLSNVEITELQSFSVSAVTTTGTAGTADAVPNTQSTPSGLSATGTVNSPAVTTSTSASITTTAMTSAIYGVQATSTDPTVYVPTGTYAIGAAYYDYATPASFEFRNDGKFYATQFNATRVEIDYWLQDGLAQYCKLYYTVTSGSFTSAPTSGLVMTNNLIFTCEALQFAYKDAVADFEIRRTWDNAVIGSGTITLICNNL